MEFGLFGNRYRVLLFSIGFLFCLLVFIFSSEATFYEIRGRLLWCGAPLRAASAYLLNDIPRISAPDKESPQAASRKSFSEEYAALEKENNNISMLSDAKAAKQERKKIKNNLEKLIRKYKTNTISLDKKGEFYLNVSPGASYHIFILKKEGFLKKNTSTVFWLQSVYFNPGEVLEPKEYTFSETNVVTW